MEAPIHSELVRKLRAASQSSQPIHSTSIHRYQNNTTLSLSLFSPLPTITSTAKMSDNSATIPQDSAMDQDHSFAEEKGKGKAPAEHITEDSAMDEDDDDDSDDEDEEV